MVRTHSSAASSQYRPPRVLIVEDDFLIAELLTEMVLGLGYSVVGVTQTLDGALKAISELNFDVALLDINLGGRRTPETADLLLEQGIPFAFVSGYEHVADPQYAHVPMVLKPFSDAQIGAVLTTLVGPGEVQNMIAVGTVSSTPPSL